MKRRGRSLLLWIYGGTIAGHLAFGVVTALLPTPERSEAVAIELADIKKKKDPPKPPPPPPPPKEDKPKPPPPRPASQSQAKMAAQTTKTELPPMPEVGADGFADLGGVALGGGGGEGIPIGGPAPEALAATARPAPKATARRVEQLAAAVTGGCNEPPVKPRMKKAGQLKKYNKEAQIAEIEGVIKVQVTVDETGKVISAHVLNSLGYGLDEIALAAARDSEFEPATLCGKPIVGTKILPFRFQLQ